MHATDENWTCMGKGPFGCGATGAMTTGKLKFSGPKVEAMGVIGPFDSFLQMTGRIPSDKGASPWPSPSSRSRLTAATPEVCVSWSLGAQTCGRCRLPVAAGSERAPRPAASA